MVDALTAIDLYLLRARDEVRARAVQEEIERLEIEGADVEIVSERLSRLVALLPEPGEPLWWR